MIDGIDYYAGDGSPNLSGLAFAFIKATEGVRLNDPAYQRERARIRAAGLVFGAYHFGHPEQDVNAEVEHFVSFAQPGPGDVLFLDYEDENGNFSQLSNAHLTWWKNTWISQVKRRCPNNRVGLYCNVDTWVNKIDDNDAGDFLFIAQYGGAGPHIKDPWLIWQHGTDHVDYDKARFDSVDAMRAWAHQEDEDMTPDQDARLRRIEALVTPGGPLSNELIHGDNPQRDQPRVAGNDQILLAVQQLLQRTEKLQQDVDRLSAGKGGPAASVPAQATPTAEAPTASGAGEAPPAPPAHETARAATAESASADRPSAAGPPAPTPDVARVGQGAAEGADPDKLAQALGPLLREHDADQVKQSLIKHVGQQFADAFAAATRVFSRRDEDAPRP